MTKPHTPGKITVHVSTASKNRMGGVVTLHDSSGNDICEMGGNTNDGANAKRLALCWNAFEGTPNANIDAMPGPVSELAQVTADIITEANRQIAALTQALFSIQAEQEAELARGGQQIRVDLHAIQSALNQIRPL
jgi:hypothetical protein